MIALEEIKEIAQETPSKIVLMVLDGLGGLPHPETGRTELETARTPNLDALAARSLCGLIDPVSPGVTPGSGPAHLALFGYDPLRFQIGRGVLEALGVDFPMQDTDVAARANFCSVDQKGVLTDRRAGRISTERCTQLCELLSQIKLDGAEVFVRPGIEHRFVVIFRGDGLSEHLSESDPLREDVAPLEIRPLAPGAEKTAALANQFVAKARAILANQHPANMVMLRGFAKHPNLPQMGEVFKLKPAAIATYPMYRGLAKLVGMQVLTTGSTLEEELDTLRQRYAEHDFFYVHMKKTDTAGEDGDFERKVHAIEEFDAALPKLLELGPEVLIITGDHSTPAILKSHSWHPVPLLFHAKWSRPDKVRQFSEEACAQGGLGRFPSVAVMPLAMAHALKLVRYGA